jgi:hypothetical protein
VLSSRILLALAAPGLELAPLPTLAAAASEHDCLPVADHGHVIGGERVARLNLDAQWIKAWVV